MLPLLRRALVNGRASLVSRRKLSASIRKSYILEPNFTLKSYDLFRTSFLYRDLINPEVIKEQLSVGGFQSFGEAEKTLLSDALEQVPTLKAKGKPLPHEVKATLLKLLQQCGTSREALQLAYLWYQPFHPRGAEEDRSFYKSLLPLALGRWIKVCNNPQELVLWSYILHQARKVCSAEVAFGHRLVFDHFTSDEGHLQFQQLDVKEVAILCNAWFTVSQTLWSPKARPLATRVDHLLQQEVTAWWKQEGTFDYILPMIKALRQTGYSSDQLLDVLQASLSAAPACKLNLAQATHA